MRSAIEIVKLESVTCSNRPWGVSNYSYKQAILDPGFSEKGVKISRVYDFWRGGASPSMVCNSEAEGVKMHPPEAVGYFICGWICKTGHNSVKTEFLFLALHESDT